MSDIIPSGNRLSEDVIQPYDNIFIDSDIIHITIPKSLFKTMNIDLNNHSVYEVWKNFLSKMPRFKDFQCSRALVDQNDNGRLVLNRCRNFARERDRIYYFVIPEGMMLPPPSLPQ